MRLTLNSTDLTMYCSTYLKLEFLFDKLYCIYLRLTAESSSLPPVLESLRPLSPRTDRPEHALITYTLGVKQLLVACNRMDFTEPPLCQAEFEEICVITQLQFHSYSFYFRMARYQRYDLSLIHI